MKRRTYRGQPVAPKPEDLTEEARRARMIEQFGQPEPGHGGRRSNSGEKPHDSSLKLAEKQGLLPSDPERIKQLTAIYPDLFAWAELALEEKRILEFMGLLTRRPYARVMWRSFVERSARAMGIGYDKALPLYREACAKLDSGGTVAQLQEQVAQVAQHLIALGQESVARDGGSLASQRELRESLKFVAGLAGLGTSSKITLELAQKTAGEPAPPPGDPRRGPWLQALRARMASGVGEIDAELEQSRDAGALTMGAEPPEKKRGDD